MLQFLIPIAILVISIGFYIPVPQDDCDLRRPFSGLMIFVGFIYLTILSICSLTQPKETIKKLQQLESVRATVTEQRADSLSVYERVQLTNTITEWNVWLAGEKNDATNPWYSAFTDKSVLKVEPIK
jgi:hypothetical protein